MRAVAKGLLVLAVGCAFVALTGYIVADLWYADDACPRAGWQCDAGGWGLGAALLFGAASVGCCLVAGAVWCVDRVGRRAR